MSRDEPLSDDVRELYQEMLVDHGRHPRCVGERPEAARQAEGHNPFCGDRVRLYVDLDESESQIERITHMTSGCAICTASASVMCETVTGRSVEEAEAAFESFHALVAGEGSGEGAAEAFAPFAGVRRFPVRVKCATLPWHALRRALVGTPGGAE